MIQCYCCKAWHHEKCENTTRKELGDVHKEMNEHQDIRMLHSMHFCHIQLHAGEKVYRYRGSRTLGGRLQVKICNAGGYQCLIYSRVVLYIGQHNDHCMP